MMSKFLLVSDDRISQTTQKIKSFRDLPVGWHYGSGVPPTDETIRKALLLNAEAGFAGFRKTNAFPGTDGEIQVTAYHESIYLELMLELDGRVIFIYEHNDKEIAYEGLTLNEAIARIRTFRGLTWALSGLSTSGTTTPIKSDSQASPSNLLATGVESPLLIQSASYEPGAVFVSTSKDTTQTLLEHPQFSGTSPLKYFLKTAS
jgi:hypothetical protein